MSDDKTRTEIKAALLLLQAAVTARFGMKVESETGGCTLEIAHDRVELTGQNHRLLGLDAAEVAAELTGCNP